MLSVGSLFSGVGGLELGLERAGMSTAFQVETDTYCRRVLELHWPQVPRHDDVLTFPTWWTEQGRPHADLICAGFPCQPFSIAGKQLGTNDDPAAVLRRALADLRPVRRPHPTAAAAQDASHMR